MQNLDLSDLLQNSVLKAIGDCSPLIIQGGGSKSFYGGHAVGEPLQISGHCGIVAYEPTELVLTARSGTLLSTVESVLDGQGQMLAFEPPHFGPNATLGGAVACGLSGPRRPYSGSVRDSVLGVKLINGKGEILRFGGQVMKNVAGFDVSRLMAGALGTLGVLLEVSLKVVPKPEAEETFCFDMTAEEALAAMVIWSNQPWPLSAACHDGQCTYIRLSGAEAAVRACGKRLGGEPWADGGLFWAGLREQKLAFFQSIEDARDNIAKSDGIPAQSRFLSNRPLWRISLPPAYSVLPLPGPCLIDWAGALRWVKTDAAAETVFALARQVGGHACLFRSSQKAGPVFQPLSGALKALHLRLKQAFDPHGIFNHGRMYQEW